MSRRAKHHSALAPLARATASAAGPVQLVTAVAAAGWLTLPARGQDASALVYMIGPPILLAPFLAALLRTTWVRRGGHVSAPSRDILITAGIEVLLWMATAALIAIMLVNEALYVAVAVALCTTLTVSWYLNRRLARSSTGIFPRWWEAWLLLAAVPLSLAVLILLAALVVLVSGI